MDYSSGNSGEYSFFNLNYRPIDHRFYKILLIKIYNSRYIFGIDTLVYQYTKGHYLDTVSRTTF